MLWHASELMNKNTKLSLMLFFFASRRKWQTLLCSHKLSVFANKSEAGSAETDTGWVSFVRLLMPDRCTQYCLSVQPNSLFNFKKRVCYWGYPPVGFKLLLRTAGGLFVAQSLSWNKCWHAPSCSRYIYIYTVCRVRLYFAFVVTICICTWKCICAERVKHTPINSPH